MIESAQIPDGVWRKSSYSGSNAGECVEVALHAIPHAIPVRDSKNPTGPLLAFHATAFTSFIVAVRRGEFG